MIIKNPINQRHAMMVLEDPVTDALYAGHVSSPEITIDPVGNVQREALTGDLGSLGDLIGGIVCRISFDAEWRIPHSLDPAVGGDTFLGMLLKACGYRQDILTTGATGRVLVHQNLRNRPAVGGVFGQTWTISDEPTLDYPDMYAIHTIVGGVAGGDTPPSGLRVTGGNEENETTIPRLEKFGSWIYYPVGVEPGDFAITYVLASNAGTTSCTFTLTGTIKTGMILTFMICGELFEYTVLASDTTKATLAASLATAIGAAKTRNVFATGNLGDTFYASTIYYYATADATEYTLGHSLATVKPDMTNAGTVSISTQNKWSALTLPESCYLFTPRPSESKEVNIHLYYGHKHYVVSGALGTFTVSMQAGDTPTANFVLYGLFTLPNDISYDHYPHDASLKVALDQLDYKNIPVIQRCHMLFGLYGAHLRVETFSFDQGNTISRVRDANSSNGNYGVKITRRRPTGSINPEEANSLIYNPWEDIQAMEPTSMLTRFGGSGDDLNGIWMYSPNVQISNAVYAGRDELLAWNKTLIFRGGRNQPDTDVYFVFVNN